MNQLSQEFLEIARRNTAVNQLKQLIEETITLVETHLPHIHTAATRELFNAATQINGHRKPNLRPSA
jgi:hypothetical protein